MSKHAITIENSGNSKLGVMSTTYASLYSCPRNCRFLHSKSCYGNTGYVSFISNKLKKAGRASCVAIAKEEAEGIDKLTGKLPLRLHTIGDCANNEAANIVARAAERYMGRHGEQAYTYTHAWREVERSTWGAVSVLASCETVEEVKEAYKAGYAPSMVVPQFVEALPGLDGLKLLPCPKQLGTADACSSCCLCMKDAMLREKGLVITFKAHGPTLRAKAMLEKANEQNS